MSGFRGVLIVCTLLLLLVLCFTLAPPTRAADAVAPPESPVTGPGVPPEPLPIIWKAGEVVVKFREGALAVRVPSDWRAMTSTGAAGFDELAARFGFRQVRRFLGAYRPQRPDLFDPNRIVIFRFPEELDVAQVARALLELPVVAYAHPYFIERPLDTIPNDPLFDRTDTADQWHLQTINAPAAWDIEHDCAGVKIGIMDTGLDYSHEDFQGNLWLNPYEDTATPGQATPADCNGLDDDPDLDGDGSPGNGYIDDLHGISDNWCNNNNPYVPPSGGVNFHGTHVGGIAGARGNNGIGVSGVCWAPLLMNSGPGQWVYMADMGADVTNLSWEHSLCWGGRPTVNKDAIDYAWARGTISILAAGNDNYYFEALPSACQSPGIEVAATAPGDYRAGFSNFGPMIGVSAPGQGILSSYPMGWPMSGTPCTAGQTNPDLDCYSATSGTSMAAPVAVGVTALIIAAHRNDPTWYDPTCPMGAREACSWAPPEQCPPCRVSPAKVVEHLKGTAQSIDATALDTWGGWLGQGRVDAYKAVSSPGPVPQMRVVSVSANDPLGDGDGDAEYGEDVDLIVTVASKYGPAGGPIQGTLTVHPSYAGITAVTKSSASFGDIPPGEQRDCGADPFRVHIDSSASGARVYFFLDLTDGAGYTTREAFGLLVNEGRQPGFPAPAGGATIGQPTFVELDGDGSLESVFTADGAIHALHADGTAVAGFPITGIVQHRIGFNVASTWPVAVEDADLDGRVEFFAKCYNVSTDSNGTIIGWGAIGLCAVRADGTEVADGDNDPATWGVLIKGDVSLPVLADLDGQPGLEVVTRRSWYNNELIAANMSGQTLPGFPVSAPGYEYVGALAVGDLDHDGQPEIVAARAMKDGVYWNSYGDQKIEVRGADGAVRPGWPQTVAVSADWDNAAAPLIADVDWDGTPEIVSATGGSFYVFEADGTQVPGSPIVVQACLDVPQCLPSGGACSPSAGWIHIVEFESLLAAADLNGDGEPEFVVRNEQILKQPVFNLYHQRIACRRHMRVVRWDPALGQLVSDDPLTLSTGEALRSPLLAADFGAGPQVAYANDSSLVFYNSTLSQQTTRYLSSRRWPNPYAGHFPGIYSLVLDDTDGDSVIDAHIGLTDSKMYKWEITTGAGPSRILWGNPHHDRWLTRSLPTAPPPSYGCEAITHEGTLTRNEGWGPQCNPIQLTGPVTVPAGRTLTIRPGTIIEATSSAVVLTVEGALRVEATWDDRALFHAAAGGDWQGIIVRGAAATQLTGLEVRDAREALRIENVSPTVRWSRFGSNDAGVVVVGADAAPNLERLLVISNNMGLQLLSGAHPTLDHSILYGNTTGLDNAANTVAASFVNSVFWSNGDDIAAAPPAAPVNPTYSVIEDLGGENEGVGVLHSDPLFANAGSANFHLQNTSPAIDAGDPASDYLAEPDPNGCRVDVGLYGNTAEATSKAGEFRHCACLGMTLSGTLAADEVWVPACNPYRLQGPLTVPPGVTLTVSPGTVVEGGTLDSSIAVDGLLRAEGQSGQPVLFQGHSGASWTGLDLRGAGAHTLLFAEVRHADRVRVASSAARIERSRFIDDATGLSVDDAAPVVRNNVFARNTTAVELRGPAAPQLEFCTFSGNETAVRDAGLLAGQHALATNSIFWNNTVECAPSLGVIDVDYAVARADGGCTVAHAVAGDPQFINAGADDYHLQAISPAINAGDPAADYFLEPDPNGCRVDLGAYGNTVEATSAAGSSAHCLCRGINYSGGIPLATSEVWPLACSPIRLQGDFEIAGTLTIEPGVVVDVPSGAEITAPGLLLAQGTTGAPITFRKYGANPWAGLVLLGSSVHRLEHTVIRDAAKVEIYDDAAVLRLGEIRNGGTGLVIHGGPVVEEMLFAGNQVGVELFDDAAVLRRSEIRDGGTGLVVHGSPTVVNMLLVNNELAVDVRDTSGVALDHLTVAKNRTGLTSAATTPATVKNSIFWLNTGSDIAAAASVSLSYSITERTGGVNEGVGVLHTDPQFVSPTTNNFHLQATSPAMDSGDPASAMADETFPNGCRVDMGAYGNTAAATASANGSHCTCPGVPSRYRGTITQNVVWTSACSPYWVEGILTVAAGATLTIEPGTQVLFMLDDAACPPSCWMNLKIQGALVAVGTPDQRIVFGDSDEYVDGMVNCDNSTGSNPKCHLAYFDMQNINRYTTNASDLIEHGTFRNMTMGVSVHAVGAPTPSAPVIRNCLFENNIEGMDFWQPSTPRIENCTFVRNVHGIRRQQGNYEPPPPPITVSNSIFWGNRDRDVDAYSWHNDPLVVLRYSLTERTGEGDEVVEGPGVIHTNPQFVDWAGGDYHLAPGSPAIDSADPFAPARFEPARNGCRADMGVYGNTSQATPAVGAAHCACNPYTAQGTLSQDETWTALCGPYRLDGAVDIPSGVGLTVGEGAEIMGMNPAALVRSNGRLRVEGSAANPAIFWGASAQRWDGVECAEGAVECFLSHLRLLGADALTLRSASATVSHSWFQNNDRGVFVGGASQPQIANSVFYKNHYGVEVGENGRPATRNCTLTSNDVGFVYSADPLGNPPVLDLTSSIVWGNGNTQNEVIGWKPGDPRVRLMHSLIHPNSAGKVIWGTGAIANNPYFVNYSNGDLRLSPSSPAIDAGDPASSSDQEPAPDGCRINMGFDGNTSTATTSIQKDPDGDLIYGSCDNCPNRANSDQSDRDLDGTGDVCDTCPDDPANDVDHDSVCGNVDNCPTTYNWGQYDNDQDGMGNECDPCTDQDGDGFGYPTVAVSTCPADNCPSVSNPDQANADGDMYGDVCDWCTDTDGDWFGDPGFPGNSCATDNCPNIWNNSQANADGDPFGDVCDNCPSVINPSQANADGDAGGDDCDCLPSDPLAWALAGETTDVAFDGSSKTMLRWSPPAAPGAPPSELKYDLLRSPIPAFTENIVGAVCVASGISGVTAEDALTPAPQRVFFYLSRARNRCGPGSAGHDSGGTERVVRDCP